jgi:hypothetical protein
MAAVPVVERHDAGTPWRWALRAVPVQRRFNGFARSAIAIWGKGA